MWELKTAADLRPGSTYVQRGDYLASARGVTGSVVPGGDAVTFTSVARWSWDERASEELNIIDASTAVYILACTCNGMALIGKRWSFTGECRCVHLPLPKGSTS